MLVVFIFVVLGFTGLLWVLDVALDNYKELGKARYETRLAMYREGIISDWRVKPSRRDITC